MHCCLVLAVFAVAASPYFVLNTLEFGHPLKTGYEFWVPTLADKQAAFSLHNVPRQVALIWSEITASWDQFRVANLFGTGTYVVPAFIFLSALGLALRTDAAVRNQRILSRNRLLCGDRNLRLRRGAVLHTCFFPFGCARRSACGMGSGPGSQEAPFDLGVGVLAVFLLSCIGYPSQSGFKPKGGRSQAWDALHYANGNGKSLRYEAQQEFRRIFRDGPGIVLSDIEPPYLNALLPKPFVAAPDRR